MASIVSASVSESRQKAEDAHMKTEVQQVRNAVELYRQDNGGVPIPTVPEGSSYVAGSMVAEDTNEYKSSMQKLVPKYIPEVPTSPSGLSYSYLATADEEDAVFAAVLNNDDTSDGSNNSCDSVEVSNISDSCIFIDPSIEGWNPENYDCDFRSYDSETQICIDGEFASSYCSSNQTTCAWDLTDSSLVSSEMCDNLWINSGCGFNITDGENGIYMCELAVDSVCSGTSDSDYCSCI